MGGKFRGDKDCGCVPHHYTFSIDMKSVEDHQYGNRGVYHVEMSGHVDIPMKFKDDGSFDEEMPWTWTETGYMRGGGDTRTEECTIKGSLNMKFHLKGTVDDANKILHLVDGNSLHGGSKTTTCTIGRSGTAQYPSATNPNVQPWDLRSLVGVDQDVPMPFQDPNFKSTMKVRITQTD